MLFCRVQSYTMNDFILVFILFGLSVAFSLPDYPLLQILSSLRSSDTTFPYFFLTCSMTFDSPLSSQLLWPLVPSLSPTPSSCTSHPFSSILHQSIVPSLLHIYFNTYVLPLTHFQYLQKLHSLLHSSWLPLQVPHCNWWPCHCPHVLPFFLLPSLSIPFSSLQILQCLSDTFSLLSWYPHTSPGPHHPSAHPHGWSL